MSMEFDELMEDYRRRVTEEVRRLRSTDKEKKTQPPKRPVLPDDCKIVIDKKSTMSREEQIRQQVTLFTRNPNLGR